MPNGLTTVEKSALALRLWLNRHNMDWELVESLFTMQSRKHLVELVGASDSLERLLIASVVFTMGHQELFEDFVAVEAATFSCARAYGFS